MPINVDELESWSCRAAQELQEFCDEAQVAAGNPNGEDQLMGVRALLVEHNRIIQGLPLWQALVADPGASGSSDLNI